MSFQHIQHFINSSWYDRYKESPGPQKVTLIWSLIISMFAVGGLFGAVSVKLFSRKLGRCVFVAGRSGICECGNCFPHGSENDTQAPVWDYLVVKEANNKSKSGKQACLISNDHLFQISNRQSLCHFYPELHDRGILPTAPILSTYWILRILSINTEMVSRFFPDLCQSLSLFLISFCGMMFYFWRSVPLLHGVRQVLLN